MLGEGSKRDDQFAIMIKIAIDHNKPIRIGVNWGSLDQEMLKTLMDNNGLLSQPLSANVHNERSAYPISAMIVLTTLKI